MIDERSLLNAFRSGLDTDARIRTRRPGTLFQIDLPAYMADGDAVQVYVRPAAGDRLVVTDLGSTRMRMSYGAAVTAETEEELERVAEALGLQLADGELRVEVDASGLLGATLGMLQVEAQAERLARTTRRRVQVAAAFKEAVRELLVELFADANVESPYVERAIDTKGEYAVDALVRGRRPIAVAFVPNDLDAERAVVAKLKLAPAVTNVRWVAIPRDFAHLRALTRGHLMREFYTLGSSFEKDRQSVAEKLRDLAA